jgi:excisionase family DNA binding protein
MSKHRPGREASKRRPGRKEIMRARQAASAMMTVEDVATALGIGRNKAYEAVADGTVRAMRIGHRWLIPRAEIVRLTGSTPTTSAEASA